MNIRAQILATIFSAVLITGAAIIAVSHTVSKDIITEQVLRHLETTAQSRAQHVETFLGKKKRLVMQLSASEVIKKLLSSSETDVAYNENLNTVIRRLKNTAAVNPEFFDIMVLDTNGRVVASNIEERIGQDRSVDPHFITGKKEICAKDFHLSKTGEGKALLAISVPITDGNTDDPAGILVIRFDLDYLNGMMEDRTGLGETGEVYLINRDGYMITPSRFMDDSILKQRVDTQKSREWLYNDNHAEKTIMHVYEDYHGRRVLGIHHEIAGMDWCLLAEIDESEAFAPVFRLTYMMFWIVIILLAAGIIIAMLISGKISRPIVNLLHGTEEIEKGNLDYKVGTSSRDEIGRLSRAFDDMTQNLKKNTTSIDNLNREINERKRAEDALRESEEKYRRIFESIQDVYYEAGLDGTVLEISTSVENVSQYKRQELIGMSLYDIYTNPEERDEFLKLILDKEKVNDFEISLTDKDGSKHPCSITTLLVKDEQGNPIKLVGSMRDITDRKRAEEKLKESEKMFRLITENMNDIVLLMDLNGKVLYAGPSHKEILGYEPEERVGTFSFEIVHPEDMENVAALLKTAIAASKPGRAEYRIRHADGHYIWVEGVGNFVFDEDGTAVGGIMNVRDITDRKKAAEEIKSHQEHITLINQILRHDLTNDLVVIQSAINIYNNSPEEELLEEISSRTGKSIELISRMRELESFISRHRELQICEMRDTIDEVIKNYPSTDFEIKGKTPVMADDSLSSVIDNIIGNAIIHGKADRIEITIGEATGMCEVRIADNGTGIPDEIKAKIFEEGFMHGETGHTGIGLHIVEKAMESYGGYAYVEDNEPKG
ncbi:MAG: PAS domain S-box protein, partial [Deltaproteobacteria bacterium]|nr:PAS domain S-box protein [Deltaproteobacteria bacterium]